jgi:hypothetical protein
MLDNKYLKGKIQKSRLRERQQADIKELENQISERFYVFYDKNKYNEIASLCDKYGSDKGSNQFNSHHYKWSAHTYCDFYSRTYSHCRNSVYKVFECGIGTNSPEMVSSMGVYGKPGASLRMWRDYFPNATIYGADIDKQILFDEERIKTFYIDQLNKLTIDTFWENVGEDNFDLMIDDGLHTYEAGINLFINSIEHLSSAGIYIIEDVLKKDLIRYKKFFNNYNYMVDFITMFRQGVGLGDNSLIVIRKNL